MMATECMTPYITTYNPSPNESKHLSPCRIEVLQTILAMRAANPDGVEIGRHMRGLTQPQCTAFLGADDALVAQKIAIHGAAC